MRGRNGAIFLEYVRALIVLTQRTTGIAVADGERQRFAANPK